MLQVVVGITMLIAGELIVRHYKKQEEKVDS